MTDWTAYFLLIIGWSSLINCLAVQQQDLRLGITNQFKYVEKYQLPGELRDYCESFEDCREFAYFCNRNHCDCADGFRPDEKNKTCIGGVGAKCHYDSHCIENAFCRHQLLCFCKKDFWVMPNDHWNCRAEWESRGNKLTSKLLIVQLLIAGLIKML